MTEIMEKIVKFAFTNYLEKLKKADKKLIKNVQRKDFARNYYNERVKIIKSLVKDKIDYDEPKSYMRFLLTMEKQEIFFRNFTEYSDIYESLSQVEYNLLRQPVV